MDCRQNEVAADQSGSPARRAIRRPRPLLPAGVNRRAALTSPLLFRPELRRSFFLNPVKDVVRNVIRITGSHRHAA
jgi:hypothetical protein